MTIKHPKVKLLKPEEHASPLAFYTGHYVYTCMQDSRSPNLDTLSNFQTFNSLQTPSPSMIFNDLQCLSGATWKCLCVPGFGVEALPSNPLTPPWAVDAVADDFDTTPVSPSYSPAWRVAKSARRCSRARDPAVLPLEDLCCEAKQHWRVRDALAFTPKALQGDVLVRLLKDTDPGLRESVLLAL